MTSTSSKNFTGLYQSGAATVNPNAAYGNANVVSLLAAGSDGANTVGNISATGNITTGGILTDNYYYANGAPFSGGGGGGSYGNANVTALLASFGSNSISTTGNVTAAYFSGDGSQLSNINAGNIIGTYGNANVANFMANYGSNTISSTGNVTSGNVLTSGVVSATGNIRGGNLNTAGIVSATGNVTGGNITTGGVVSATGGLTTADGITATGNISGANIIGNIYTASIIGTVANGNIDIAPDGTGHVNIDADTLRVGDNNQPALIASRGTGNLTLQAHEGDATQSNVRIVEGANGNVEVNLNGTGNLNVARISASGNITGSYFFGNGSQLTGLPATYGNANVATLLANFGSNSISTTGNVTAGYFIGDGSALTSLTGANVTGTVANATYAVSAGSATTAVTVTGAAQPNITSVGTLSSLTVTANVTGGNINTSGQVSATGNITGSYIFGNGSQLTGITTTYGNSNVANFLANYGSNTISSTGNITANVITATGNLTSPTITTTGATGNILGVNTYTGGNVSVTGNVIGGNVWLSASLINNINAWNVNSTPQSARIVIGNGWNGDYSATYDPLLITRGSQLSIMNKQVIGNADSNQSLRNFSSMLWADMNGGTLTNTNRRLQGATGLTHIGNGTITLTAGQVSSLTGAGGTVLVGNVGNTTLGNATVSHASAGFNGIVAGTGANIGNAFGMVTQINSISATGNVTNAVGAVVTFAGTPTAAPTTVIGYYMGNGSSPGTFGASNSNTYRGATNYYFLRNDDTAAQNQLGSLRSYTEFNGVSGTTSGSLTIDKNNGQVQQVNLTGNVSSLAFSNFVSSASDGTNTDEQSDTVTIIFNQGATGNFGVTFPTGSTYKYAGNITALQSTAANSVSLVSVSAIRISSTTTYLLTISPGFV